MSVEVMPRETEAIGYRQMTRKMHQVYLEKKG